jgi:hypothetical protein
VAIDMATNLALETSLIEQARVCGGRRTKKAAVTEALNALYEPGAPGKS